MKTGAGIAASAWRLFALLLLSALALQLFFVARVALMRVVDPQSTTFERSEIARLASAKPGFAWRQRWLAYERVAAPLKRAVVAAEDAGFNAHGGVEWDSIERAWQRQQRRAEWRPAGRTRAARAMPKLVGGSTITQQLAKNLLLSGERNFVRKGQELVIAMLLEALLDKRRILELYLNHVEWGEGVFGAEAAARHHFRIGAGALGPAQAAQLAVMLPAPKRFEKRPGSAYVVGRAGTVSARMGAVELP